MSSNSVTTAADGNGRQERRRRGPKQVQQLIAVGKIHRIYQNRELFYFTENFVEKFSEAGMRRLAIEHERPINSRFGYYSPKTWLLAEFGRESFKNDGMLTEHRFMDANRSWEAGWGGQLIPSSSWLIPTGQLVRYSNRYWYMPAIFEEKLIWVVRLHKNPLLDTLCRVRNLQTLRSK